MFMQINDQKLQFLTFKLLHKPSLLSEMNDLGNKEELNCLLL